MCEYIHSMCSRSDIHSTTQSSAKQREDQSSTTKMVSIAPTRDFNSKAIPASPCNTQSTPPRTKRQAEYRCLLLGLMKTIDAKAPQRHHQEHGLRRKLMHCIMLWRKEFKSVEKVVRVVCNYITSLPVGCLSQLISSDKGVLSKRLISGVRRSASAKRARQSSASAKRARPSVRIGPNTPSVPSVPSVPRLR
jgi:hypothetical protein